MWAISLACRALSSCFVSVHRAGQTLPKTRVRLRATLILVTRIGAIFLFVIPLCVTQFSLSFTEGKDFTPARGTAILFVLVVAPVTAVRRDVFKITRYCRWWITLLLRRVQYKISYVSAYCLIKLISKILFI